MNATATLRNTSPIANIISGVMKDATTEGNRQAELVVAMFASEATYTSAAIANVFSKDGADKTAIVDEMLEDVSDDYGKVLSHMQSIKDKPAKERSTADAFTLDGLNRKARAARIMFERALKSVYWLREARCQSIRANKIGTGALKAKMPDPEDEGEFVNETFSCTQIANRGDKLIREKLGKASKEKSDRAKNPTANVIADASKSLAAVLSSLATDGKRKPIDEFDDTVEQSLETTLREVFAMKFADDRGKVDFEDVKVWINDTFNAPASKAPAKPAADAKGKTAAA